MWTWKTADGTPVTHYGSQATKPMAFAKDAPVLAFSQDGRSLQFLDTSEGMLLQPVEGHRNSPSVLFCSDGSLISYDDNKICLWTAGAWRFRTSFEFHDKGQRFCFGPSQDFFVRTVGTKVESRSLKNGDVIKEWMLKSAPDFVVLMHDGKTLAAGNLYHSEEPKYKGTERFLLRLLDIPSGAQKEIQLPYQPWEVKLCPTKAVLALRDGVNYVDALDTATGKLQRLVDDKTVDVWQLNFSPDGRRLYFSSMPADSLQFPAKVTLASVELSSEKKKNHAMAEQMHAAVISPDGRVLVYSPVKPVTHVYEKCAVSYTTPSKEIVLWETASESVRARFEKTNAWVNSVCCSPDSRYLATGMHDSTILIWDLLQPVPDK